MSYEMAQAVRGVLIDGLDDGYLTKRSREALAAVREEFSWVGQADTVLVVDDGADRSRWWSFAGDRYNSAIAERLRQPGLRVSSDGLGVTLQRGSSAEALAVAVVASLNDAREAVAASAGRTDGVIEQSVSALKFAEAVPASLLAGLSRRRFYPASEALVMRGVGVGIRLLARE
jgi:hypothetical protein